MRSRSTVGKALLIKYAIYVLPYINFAHDLARLHRILTITDGGASSSGPVCAVNIRNLRDSQKGGKYLSIAPVFARQIKYFIEM